MAAAIKQVCSY